MKKRLTKKARWDKETKNIAIAQAFCESDIRDILANKKLVNTINTCSGLIQLDPDVTKLLSELAEKHGIGCVFAIGECMDDIAQQRKNPVSYIASLAARKIKVLRAARAG